MASSLRRDDEGNLDDAVVAEINITPLTDVFLVLLIAGGIVWLRKRAA